MALDFENLRTLKWPPTTEETAQEGFVPREVKSEPSTERGKRIKKHLLGAKMMLDPQFSLLYTEAWRKYEGEPLLIRRGRAYKYAIENIEPAILPDELITMQRTRFMRGAPTYLQYSQKFYPHMIERAEAGGKESDDVYDVGEGGGRAAINKAGVLDLGGFAMLKEDVNSLLDACKYWDGRCVEDEAMKYLEENMPEHKDLANAFDVTLFPPSVISIMEGRWVPAYDIIVCRGLEDVIREAQEKIQNTIITTREVAEQVNFWRATILVCEGVINWAHNYAKKACEMAATEADAQRKQDLLEMAEVLEWVPAKPARTFREGLQAAWIGHIATIADGPVVGLSPGRWGQLLEPLYQADLKAGRITPEKATELLELMRVKFSSEEYVSPRSWQALASGNMFQHMVINHREEGVTLEDARDVAMGGCVESQMQGTCHGICHPAFYNEVKTLEIVLHDGVDPRTGKRVVEPLGEIDSFEKLWNAWCKVEEKFMKVYMRCWNCVLAVKREINPLIFPSVLVKDCVKNGKPLDYNGARYNRGFASGGSRYDEKPPLRSGGFSRK